MNAFFCIAQINPTAGDVQGNARQIAHAADLAARRGAGLLLTSELALCGGPSAADLLLRPDFVQSCMTALGQLCEASAQWPELTLVIGHPRPAHTRPGACFNAVSVVRNGRLLHTRNSTALCSDGVRDDARYFVPAPADGPDGAMVVDICGLRTALLIGAEIQRPAAVQAARQGRAQWLLHLHASPFYAGRQKQREQHAAHLAQSAALPLVAVHMVGGHDEWVFDGSSFAVDACGQVTLRAPAMQAALLTATLGLPGAGASPEAVDGNGPDEQALLVGHAVSALDAVAPDGQDSWAWGEAGMVILPDGPVSCAPRGPLDGPPQAGQASAPGTGWSALPLRPQGPVAPAPQPLEEIWRALVLAVRDYVGKNRFPGVLLGLSGGMDSALVLAVAVDALGPQRVRTVMMPSRYTADISMQDAQEMCERLGVRHDVLPIAPVFEALGHTLAPLFAGLPEDVTEENLQARSRGTLLMALSNKTGAVVLTTGNKSELATGYCTLYGDMAGGFAVLRDLFKTRVFALARWRNAHDPFATGTAPIPERIITRPPSAELREDQRDEDSLAPYPVLDDILERHIEAGQGPAAIIAAGHDPALVRRVLRLLRGSEYKRRQAPVGPRMSRRGFGQEWAAPLTSGYPA